MSKKPKLCTVKQDGPLYRVVDADGSVAAGVTAPADGGGFFNERDAQHVAAQINERRKAKANG
jgi:hypothetical protein